MALIVDKMVKFRREKYEDLSENDSLRSPNTVEIQSAPGSSRHTGGTNTSGIGSPTSNTPTPSAYQSFPEDTFTVDQAIDRIGFGKFQLKLSFLTGLAWMADAMEMMILSILAPALHCEWNLPNWQKAMLTTVVFAGMMLSSSYWGKVCDKYGRKFELIMCAVFTFYFGFLSAFAPTFLWMIILRGLTGFGIGGVPQSVTLYSEFLPSKARAKCVVLIEIFWAIGACFIVILSIFIMPILGWRWLLIFASLPLLGFALACVWLPESPRYDVAKGDYSKALETLKRIADENDMPMPLGKLVDSSGGWSQNTCRGELRSLFTPELRVTTCLLWFIWLANAFAYYGIVLMTTELFESGDECHGGVDVDLPKSGTLQCRAACKMLTYKDYIDLLWTTLAEFPALFITVLIIEWFGRKKTMAVEFVIFSLFVFLVNMCNTRLVLTLFLFIARAFISGAFQAAYVYTPEVYPTTTRALGLGASSGMSRIGALTTPFVAQVMLRESVNLVVSIYGSICIVAAIAALALPIETKGREMKDSHFDPSSLKKEKHDKHFPR